MKDEYLYDLFSCKKCEHNPSDGTRTLDAFVMDGTALGIFGSCLHLKDIEKLFQPYLESRTSNA